MSVDVETLVKSLKKKRESEGLSLRALSSKIGVSFSSLARIERREGQPDNNSVIRILEWLGQEGRDAGLSFEHVALVHFRANKNIQSKTVRCLLGIAEALKSEHGLNPYRQLTDRAEETYTNSSLTATVSLPKSQMEKKADELRADLGYGPNDPFDALSVEVEGVDVWVPSEISAVASDCLNHLYGAGSGDWSAMSVPLDEDGDRWAIVRNDRHSIERQRVTYLEECWHILLGHRLTKIAKISDAYGRTYDSDEEHDAYYLAAATLVPQDAVVQGVESGTGASLPARFGVSQDLVEYRIKRLGLWSSYKGKEIKLSTKS